MLCCVCKHIDKCYSREYIMRMTRQGRGMIGSLLTAEPPPHGRRYY